jgi:hypothetical protein
VRKTRRSASTGAVSSNGSGSTRRRGTQSGRCPEDTDWLNTATNVATNVKNNTGGPRPTITPDDMIVVR